MPWKLPDALAHVVQHFGLGNHLSGYRRTIKKSLFFHLNAELCPILLETKIVIKKK